MFVDELKRTRGSEAELVNIACSALHIRNPRAHVPLSLAATCQPCSVSLKAGRSTYKALQPTRTASRSRQVLLFRVRFARLSGTSLDAVYDYA